MRVCDVDGCDDTHYGKGYCSKHYQRQWRGRSLAQSQREKTPAERFEEKFVKTGGCWLWKASKSTKGYGLIGVNGKVVAAHRFAYRLYVGPIHDGLFVCHHCDTPACVNPSHLFLGDHQANMDDMRRKGREKHLHGEACGSSKLTAVQVVEIRRLYKPKTLKQLGEMFGVNHTTIGRIVNRKHWKNI